MRNRNLEIERLRAFAIIMAALCHLPFYYTPPVFRGGWQGVTLFFVISGYVIYRSLNRLLPKCVDEGFSKLSIIERLDRSLNGIRLFFLRRVFRIIPIAVVWLAYGLLASIVIKDGFYEPSRVVRREVFCILTLQFNYIRQFGANSAFAPYWSLMVEEHFYLLLPFFLVVFHKPSRRLISIVLIIITITLVTKPLFANDDWGILRFSHNNFDALLSGVFVGFCTERGWGRSLLQLIAGLSWGFLFFLCSLFGSILTIWRIFTRLSV